MLTQTQVDNWDNLTPEQRAYFTRLAEGDPWRNGRQFFEEEIPPSLQNDPKGLDIYLNGGDVTTVDDNGNPITVEIQDRDWSHDISRANGGSDSADNGRFESASINRSRGSANSIEAEQAAADEQSAADAEVISNRLPNEELIDKAALGLTGGSFIADAAEFAVEGVLPIAMGLTAASKLADAGLGKTAVVGGGLGTALLVCTPPGQFAAGLYLTYKFAKFGVKAVNKILK